MHKESVIKVPTVSEFPSPRTRLLQSIGWSQLGGDIDGETAGDESGTSVSLSADGTIVAIGADHNDGTGTDAGHVRMYRWNGASWVQQGADINGDAADDRFGYSVSLSGDGSIVAIGANNNDGNGNNSGRVRVFRWDVSAWVQRGSAIDGEAAGDSSGRSVSLSSDGSTVAIGAYLNDGNGPDSGHVRVYRWNGASWQKLGLDIDGEAEGDNSGRSVSLSGDGSIVAIGAYLNDGNGPDSGHVRVYRWNGANWVQLGGDINGQAAGDNSGCSVSLSDDGLIVAIGARYNDGNGSNSGHVRIHRWNGIAWIQQGNDINGEAAGDDFGWAVSLSSDGSTVAVGADLNNGGGTDSGHVRVYRWNGTVWEQQGLDIDGESADDRSGYAVSLSANGYILAVGAYNNDGVNGVNSGHVRIFSMPLPPSPKPTSQPTPLPTLQPSRKPTLNPTPLPTAQPSRKPTLNPTPLPTAQPSRKPTLPPTPVPTPKPTPSPTKKPTPVPTSEPTVAPTNKPTLAPTKKPTDIPTALPTSMPTKKPTLLPTLSPSTLKPTAMPSNKPTAIPTSQPTPVPTQKPTPVPTKSPTAMPTNMPTPMPTQQPTENPTSPPTSTPTAKPTFLPTLSPTTAKPTTIPTKKPTMIPTVPPTQSPSQMPTAPPTAPPTLTPTKIPSALPTQSPTTLEPTATPTNRPTVFPTASPTLLPTQPPTKIPTPLPTTQTPTVQPSVRYFLGNLT
eukprot:CCRYP_007292-RE/>CCRYP_007292-RE protein AED:0.02 eAED:-0.01 QI:0/-1/0/1/-1/1/1/0/726